jgi:tol-pal system protein YbgF
MSTKYFYVVLILLFGSVQLRAGSFLFGNNKKETEKLANRVDSLESEIAALRVGLDSLAIQMDRVIAVFREIKRLEGYEQSFDVEPLDSSGGINLKDMQSRIDNIETRLSQLETESRPHPADLGEEINIDSSESGPVEDSNRDQEQLTEIQKQYNKAKRLFDQKKYKIAIKEFKKIIKSDKPNSLTDNAHFWIGVAYRSMKQYDKAIIEFTEVLNYEDSNKKDDALYNIGRSLVSSGDHEKAKIIYQRLIDEYPDSEFVNLAIKQMKEL